MSRPKLYVPQGFYETPRWTEAKLLRQTLDMAKTRLLVIACAFLLAFLVIAGRLIEEEEKKFLRVPEPLKG